MDQPDLEEGLHRAALVGLEQINRISRTSAILWPCIRRLANENGARQLRVLDVACGGGDVAIALKRRAEKLGVSLHVAGCDISPVALKFAARRAARCGLRVRFFQADAIASTLPPDYDVVMCSLFLHHLARHDAVTVLGKMAGAARRLVLVDDLVRSRLGYLLALLGTRLFTRSSVVRFDGPLSVRRAFDENEVILLAKAAGLKDTRLSRHWPERFLLTGRPSRQSSH